MPADQAAAIKPRWLDDWSIAALRRFRRAGQRGSLEPS
jgi:hypothetical protein